MRWPWMKRRNERPESEDAGGDWTCHICKRRRLDCNISVASHVEMMSGIPVTMNVRFCNDNPDCIERAKIFSFFTPAAPEGER